MTATKHSKSRKATATSAAKLPAAQHVDLPPDSGERLSGTLCDAIDAVTLADGYVEDISEWCSELILNVVEAGQGERIVTAIECLSERVRAGLGKAKGLIDPVRDELLMLEAKQQGTRALQVEGVRHG
jgi:hypothetical protein